MKEFFNPDDFMGQQLKKKVLSYGSSWQERLDHEREESESREGIGRYSKSEVFGHNVLSSFDFINHSGNRYKKAKEGLPKAIINDQLKSEKKFYKFWLNECQNELIDLVKKRPASVKNLLDAYFKSIPNFDQIQNQLLGKDPKSRLEFASISRRLGFTTEILEEDLDIESLSYFIIQKYSRNEKILSEEILIPILSDNKKRVIQKEKEILKEIKKFSDKIKAILLQKSLEGKLLLQPEIIKERISKINIRILDALTANLSEKWGDYDSDDHRIRLSAEVPEDKRWGVYVHEIFHAISGQIDIKIYDPDSPDDPNLTRFANIKVGTHFSKERRFDTEEEKRSPQLRWLNEGLTEMLTKEVTGEAVAYNKEIELVKLFLEQGVPEELFFKAYFENYGESKDEKNTFPYTREMFDFLNKKFGKRFLINLDYFIQIHEQKENGSGAKLASLLWQEKGETFPIFLEGWLKNQK